MQSYYQPSAYAGAYPSAYASSTYGQRSIGAQPSYIAAAGAPQGTAQPFVSAQPYGMYPQAAAFGGYPYGGYGAIRTVAAAAPAAPKVQREVSERAAAWTAKNQWDFDELPHPDGFRFYMSSVMLCASSDGVLDPKEKAWVLGYAAALGSPADLMRELESMTVENLKRQNLGEDFEKFCARTDKRSTASKRGIIYDAIRAASADGVFHTDERQSVVNLALKFGLSKEVVAELEALHNEERALSKRKEALVHRFGNQ